jgi:hypothetical protein
MIFFFGGLKSGIIDSVFIRAFSREPSHLPLLVDAIMKHSLLKDNE